MKRAVAVIMTAAMFFAALSGCFFASGEELYSLPQLPQEYVELQNIIDEALESGAEYAAPMAGGNRQSVQLRDLDGSGKEEALVFFRSGEERPLKIYILRHDNENYSVAAIIEGDGANVDSIDYIDLNQDGWSEIVVGFRISDGITKGMSVYSIKDWELTQIVQSSYSEYTFCDFDEDDSAELLAIHYDEAALTGSVELFDFVGENITSTSANLSRDILSVSRLKTARLQDGKPAVFVSSMCGEDSMLTDIFIMQEGAVENITLDEWSGVSSDTMQNSIVYATDIDGDGVTELPQPEKFPNTSQDDNEHWKVYWYGYYSDGSPLLKWVTYHNYTDGWYFDLPEGWEDVITVSRTENRSDERVVTFSIWRGEYLEPIPILRFYTLSGDNKEERAQLNGRQLLQVSSSYYYAYELLEGYEDWELAIEASEIGERFSLIRNEWSSEET